MKTKTDLELIALMGSDDKRAFEELYRRYKVKITGYLRKGVIETDEVYDLVQDVFMNLWDNRKKISITTSVNSFIYSLAKHKKCNHIRAKLIRKNYAISAVYELDTTDTTCDAHANVVDIKRVIKRRLKLLPPRAAQAFRLSRFNYLSIPDVAKVMNVSTRTVENYLHVSLDSMEDIPMFFKKTA